MDKKSFKKYFTQTKSLFYTSIGIVGGAVLLYFINYFFVHEWMLYQGSYVVGTVGALCLISYFAIRIKDSAVDEYAQSFNKAMENELDTFVNETEKHKIIKRVYDYTSGSYKLWSDEIKCLKFGTDSTPRCEIYQGLALTHTPETLYVVVGELDLMTGEHTFTKFSSPISDIKTVQTVDKSFTKEYKKNNRFVETHIFEIQAGDAAIFSTVHADAMTDEAVQKLVRTAESKQG